MLDVLISALTQGLIYALLCYGLLISYKILDFPDLTVDGSFPLGAAVTALLITNGVHPLLTLPVAMLAGALAGLATGLIHVCLKVRDLLAGIITMTALFSIDLKIAGSNLPIPRGVDTVFTLPALDALLGSVSLSGKKLIVSFVIALLFKFLLDLYFRTGSGMLLRAAGDNPVLVTSLAKSEGKAKILGLVLSNSLVALCGAVVCQEQRSFSSTMGTGQMVLGLASVIIGLTVFKKLSFVKLTTAALVGSILYKFCIQAAILAGLDPSLLKLITAVLFLAILAVGSFERRRKGGGARA